MNVDSIINHILYLAGETARVCDVEPYRAFVVDIQNGRRVARYLPGYHGMRISLSHDIHNTMRLRYALGQNVNAAIRLGTNYIILDRRRETLPYTAPQPR
jgi:hypothetical protein